MGEPYAHETGLHRYSGASGFGYRTCWMCDALAMMEDPVRCWCCLVENPLDPPETLVARGDVIGAESTDEVPELRPGRRTYTRMNPMPFTAYDQALTALMTAGYGGPDQWNEDDW